MDEKTKNELTSINLKLLKLEAELKGIMGKFNFLMPKFLEQETRIIKLEEKR